MSTVGEEIIASGPHEEEPYFFDCENRPQHIAIAPVTLDVEAVEKFRESTGTGSAMTTCASASLSTRTASRVFYPLWRLVKTY